jgi:hypothetical protein
MRNTLVPVCVFLALACSACPQQPPANSASSTKAAPPSDLTNLLDGKIKSEWQAIKNKDQKAFGELLTDDYVAVEADSNGERYKWKVLSELQDSMVTDFTLSFLKVTVLCPDAAFVRYEVFIKFPPKSLVRFEKILIGEVWVKRDGSWKAMHYQETKVK